jgi:hypothetical protein
MNHPAVVFALSFLTLWATAQIGARFLAGVRDLDQEEREDFGFILGAALTLLGLIIGFSFSMAIGRYDQRKNYEEEEANAIGTEYVRADLLPSGDAEKIHALLRQYLDQRILFYQSRDANQLLQINKDTARLQNEMWSAVKSPALQQPTAVSALAVSGMNDVLNSQGYTQAAWWNRIPIAAWGLMVAIAICCNLLVGFASRHAKTEFRVCLLMILPLVLSISFLLLADIDSPRGGLIRVRPQNLLSLAPSLNP